MIKVKRAIRKARVTKIMRTIDEALEGLDKGRKDALLHKIRTYTGIRLAKLCPHGIGDPCECAVCCGLRKEAA